MLIWQGIHEGKEKFADASAGRAEKILSALTNTTDVQEYLREYRDQMSSSRFLLLTNSLIDECIEKIFSHRKDIHTNIQNAQGFLNSK